MEKGKKSTEKKVSEKDTSTNVILIALILVVVCGICGYFMYEFSTNNKEVEKEVSYHI